MSAQRQTYMEPQPYFDADKQRQTPAGNLAAADRTKLDRLRAEVKEADAAAASATDWPERTRREQDAKSLARELQSAEFNARLVQQGGGTQRAGQQAAGQPSPGYVVSDCGSAYLFVANTQKRAPRAAAAAAGTEQQFYAEPTPPTTIHNT